MPVRGAIRNRRNRGSEHGAIAIQTLVILVPVLLVFGGFAVDLGRMYVVRAELKQAANAAALAAAANLWGTEASQANAEAAALRATTATEGDRGNRFDFAGQSIGNSSGNLISSVGELRYFDLAADAVSSEGASTSGTTAKYVRVTVNAEAPLIFFALLNQGQDRKTAIVATATAGISAPLCQACGIEPMAIAPLNIDDTTDFGYLVGNRYTFAYQCTGTPAPTLLAGTTGLVRFLLLNRYDGAATLFPDEQTQLFRIGVSGLVGSTNPALSCVTVNSPENIWESATTRPCNQQVVQSVTSYVCGLGARFDNTTLTGQCESIGEAATLAAGQLMDTDLNDLEDFGAYTGNGRRIITVPVVDALATGGGMVVLGYRQFLLQPIQGSTALNPVDRNARFGATYLGTKVPVRQGRFDGCTLAAGPGKVVLHQ